MKNVVGILLDSKDNVVTVTEDVQVGDTVVYRSGDDTESVVSLSEIGTGHKISLVDIPAGGEVIKYGHFIGTVLLLIKKGQHVDHHNITGRHVQKVFEE